MIFLIMRFSTCLFFNLVAYCTMLAASQSESERQKIRNKMNDDPVLAKILKQLDTGKGDDDMDETMEARAQRKRREENEDTGGPGGQVQGTRNLIDLEDLIFAQGSHFMANKRCQLPDGSFRKQRKGYVQQGAQEPDNFQIFYMVDCLS